MSAAKRSVESFLAVLREVQKQAEKAVMDAFAKRMLTLANDSLSKGQSAAGRALKKNADGTQPALKGAFSIVNDGKTVRIETSNPLAYHQTGAYREGTEWRLPRRPVLPYLKLNARWAKWLTTEAEAALQRPKF